MNPMPNPVSRPKAQGERAFGADDDQFLLDRMALLEVEVRNLRVKLTASEAKAELAIDSENFMLGEVQKASEQLLCKHPNRTFFLGRSTA